jgi:hypothetical protein
MPRVKPNETEKEWMARCMPAVLAEGKKQEQAVAQCLNMYRQKDKDALLDKLRGKPLEE